VIELILNVKDSYRNGQLEDCGLKLKVIKFNHLEYLKNLINFLPAVNTEKIKRIKIFILIDSKVFNN
jgi:hypothetical protein